MEGEEVTIELKLARLQTFVSESKAAATAVEGIGSATVKASEVAKVAAAKVPGVVGLIGKAARESVTSLSSVGRSGASVFGRMESAARSSASRIKGHLGGIWSALRSGPSGGGGGGGGMLAAGAAYLGISGIHSAIEQANTMRTTALALHTTTGMTTQDATAWSVAAQSYGVNARTFGMSLKQIATQSVAASHGSKSAIQIFKDLGITQKDLAATGGNMGKMYGMVLDHLNKMPGGAVRTADSTKLLGRGWMQLMPLLQQGSGAIDGVTGMMKQFGLNATDSAGAAMKFHEAQAKLKEMMMVIEMVIAQKVIPVMTKLINWVMKGIPVVFSLAKGFGKELAPAFNTVVGIGRDVVHFFEHNKDAMAALIPTIKIIIAMIILWRINQIELTAAMKTNLIFAALTLIVFGLIYAWKHFKTFRDVVIDTSRWVVNALGNIVNFVVTLPGKIAKAATGLWDGLKGDLASVINWIIDRWNALPIHGTDIGPIHIPGLPKISHVSFGAAGAVVTRPTFAVIGERGPEAVTPLNRTPGSSPIEALRKPQGGFKMPDAVVVMDRREIARAAGRYVGDREARK